VLELLNGLRKEPGKEPLEREPRLQAAAQAEAGLLAEQRTLKPNRHGLPSLFQRIESAGYKSQRMAVNLASGQPAPEDLARSWSRDRGQKQNVLGDFSQVGIGYATAADGTPYWCVVFARPARGR
jgi:uncharacterized protein YkwD